METIAKEFNIFYQALFSSKEANEYLIWLAEPIHSEYQQINNFSTNLTQDSEYVADNNLIHFFKISGKNIKLELNMTMILHKDSGPIANLDFSNIPKDIADHYLKSEKYLEQTPAIIDLTHKLITDQKTTPEKIEKIFRYVAEKFNYCYPVVNRGVENLDLNNLSGDCAEYSSLFVTMCRIAGIPARNVTGFVIFDYEIKEHGWAQIYANSNWLDVDAQYASLEDSIEIGIQKYLFNRPEFRIIFSTGFNLPLKPSLPNNFDISAIQKFGLTIDQNRAQVLQPIVFASKSRADFSDNIALE